MRYLIVTASNSYSILVKDNNSSQIMIENKIMYVSLPLKTSIGLMENLTEGQDILMISKIDEGARIDITYSGESRIDIIQELNRL